MNFRELDEILIYEFLKNLGISMIGVFMPIYIISEGLGIEYALLFIVISGFIGLVSSIGIAQLISKLGFKHSLFLSYLGIIPGILIIRSFELSLMVIVVSSVLYNLGRTFHNIGLNSEFAVDSDEKERSFDSGKMLSLPSISRIIGPLLGGLIFASLSFNSLVLLSTFLLVLSVVPLAFSGDHRDPMDYSFMDVLRDEWSTSVPLFFIRGFQAVTGVKIFALFVFTVIGSSIDVGGARTLDSLGFVLTGLLVGRLASKHEGAKFVKFGGLGAGMIHLIRGFLVTPIQVFVASFLGGIFFQIYHVPVYSRFADRAEEEDVLEFYTLRRVFFSLGNISVVGIFLLFYLLFGTKAGFISVFISAGVTSLAMIHFYSD